jgi:hypothetical protein
MCFVDLKAAYDTVNREGLLLILAQYEVSEKLCNIIRALYTETWIFFIPIHLDVLGVAKKKSLFLDIIQFP